MRTNQHERGEGRMGFIFALIVVSFVVFAGVKFVPIYVGAYDLRETIRDEVHRGSLKTNEQIVQSVLAKGLESDLPVTRKNIKVQRTHAKIILEVEFETPIDLALFTYNYHFQQEESAPLF